MISRERWNVWKRTHPMRQILFVLGWLLILLAPIIGLLPGPGGIFVLAAGVALVLETSVWAKRLYVRFRKRWPRAFHLVDRMLRRARARRQAALKARESATPGSTPAIAPD